MIRQIRKQFLNVAFVTESRWLDMLIRNAADLDSFMEMYDVATISKEY